MKLYKEILRLIKKYKYIVIARHIGADPDALGSQFALKEIIKYNFPEKEVYAVGAIASKFRFMGDPDQSDNLDYHKCLLIVVDTPDIKRIDGVDKISDYAEVIKIDHHPFIDKFGATEYIESNASSASQLVFKFAYNVKLNIPKKAAENIYLGIVGDTDRFLHDYTSKETFEIVNKLLEISEIDFVKLYKPLYLRPLAEVRFQGYIYENLKVTSNKVAYIKITDEAIKKYGVDSASAGNMINDLKFVEDILVWVFFSEDVKMGIIKANIRSRGPVINKVASNYGGGGHIYASGARLNNWEDTDALIQDLDLLAKTYQDK